MRKTIILGLALPKKKEVRPNPYQAVSIVHAIQRCAAVKAVADQRFLARRAPSLPLPDCTSSDECKCSYRKHPDRRHNDRRLVGELSKWYGGSEKRHLGDRRSSD